MDRSLYIAMSGAKQTLLAQNSNANNLANMQTTGFKSDLERFRSRPVFGDRLSYPGLCNDRKTRNQFFPWRHADNRA